LKTSSDWLPRLKINIYTDFPGTPTRHCDIDGSHNLPARILH